VCWHFPWEFSEQPDDEPSVGGEVRHEQAGVKCHPVAGADHLLQAVSRLERALGLNKSPDCPGDGILLVVGPYWLVPFHVEGDYLDSRSVWRPTLRLQTSLARMCARGKYTRIARAQ
jgi:hypothetical protein